MRFDIQLLDQCVLVPQSSESSDTLWLDVSAVNIQNTFFVNVRARGPSVGPLLTRLPVSWRMTNTLRIRSR